MVLLKRQKKQCRRQDVKMGFLVSKPYTLYISKKQRKHPLQHSPCEVLQCCKVALSASIPVRQQLFVEFPFRFMIYRLNKIHITVEAGA